ncbi:MAG: hypothetical protein QM778_15280 [Myxococcales bacterium]
MSAAWKQLALLTALALVSACGHMRVGASRAIPWDTSVQHLVPARDGVAHAPRPLAKPYAPEHPFMAPHGASSMHVDPFTTNAYSWAGPLGHQPEVASRSMGFLGGECPTINFDRRGRIVTVCVSKRTPTLLLLEPETLHVLASYELPARRSSMLQLRKTMNDTSGGAYFYLDHLDRAVVGTADGSIEVIAVEGQGEELRFVRHEHFNLARELTLPTGELDKITAVMPDFEGNYWFVARYGTLGFVRAKADPAAPRVVSKRLAGEEIENSFSMAPEGAYIVSDHALYHFAATAQGTLALIWREAYDRGTARKLGQINQGSGTTPTILGEDYVAIADNAEPRMNVLVYRRKAGANERLVCRTPVFSPGQSATENTLIGHGRSLIVENNAGYDLFLTMRGGKTSAPGLARIDVRADESGCDVMWESREISQTTVPKLSTATGLVYAYTKLPNAPNGLDAYYFTAIDFDTGKTVYRVLTGTGVRYDNNWAAISLAPDGTAFVGVLNGLIRVRDSVVPYAGTPSRPAF